MENFDGNSSYREVGDETIAESDGKIMIHCTNLDGLLIMSIGNLSHRKNV